MLFNTYALQNMAEALNDLFATDADIRIGIYKGTAPATASAFTTAGHSADLIHTYASVTAGRTGASFTVADNASTVYTHTGADVTITWGVLYDVNTEANCIVFTGSQISATNTPLFIQTTDNTLTLSNTDTATFSSCVLQFSDS